MRNALLLLLLIIAASCSRKVTPTVTPKPPVRDVAVEEIDFDFMHGRAQMNLKDDKKEVEVKTHIRIRKDSVIWMTFSVMGVQGGKALINKDSITVVNTVKKEYYVFEYGEMSKRFGLEVTYDIIQAAMLGNLIHDKSPEDEVTEDQLFDYIRQTQGNVQIVNAINRSNRKVEKVEMKETVTENSLRIGYANFQPLGDKLFPYQGTITVLYRALTGQLLSNTTITFEYVKAEIGDRQLKFPFNIPRKYDRR